MMICLTFRPANLQCGISCRARGVPLWARKNLKPFSQRFIKGLILAKVAGARLASSEP